MIGMHDRSRVALTRTSIAPTPRRSGLAPVESRSRARRRSAHSTLWWRVSRTRPISRSGDSGVRALVASIANAADAARSAHSARLRALVARSAHSARVRALVASIAYFGGAYRERGRCLTIG